jgi:rhodanese-related sulfurtransferase
MKILIDGDERLRLRNGEKGTVTVPNGNHGIHAEYPQVSAWRARQTGKPDSSSLEALWEARGAKSDVISVDATSNRIVLEAKFTWLSGIVLSKYMEIPLDGSNAPPSNDNYNTSQPNPAIASTGHGLPKIAVYVTSGADKSMAAKVLAGAGAHKTVGDGLAKALGGAGKCDAVNLTGDITKAHGAMVDGAQAAAIGSQFGVQYLCVVTISNVKGKSFNLGVKLVDAAAAKPVASASAAVDLSNAPGLLQSLAKIAAELVKGIAVTAVQSVAQEAIGGGAAAAPEPAPEDVTPDSEEFQLSARMVDVETAAAELAGEAADPLEPLSDLEQTSESVVENMHSAQAAPTEEAEPAPEITIEPETEPMTQASAQMIADTPPIETSPSRPRGPIKAAVHVTGIPPMVAKPFNSAISSALMKSKVYAGIESIDVSGTPSVPTLADAGRNAGVSYIFTINVAGQISVAIIDVAETTELAKTSIDGKITAVSAAAIAKKIVDFILKSGPKPDPDMQAAGEETAPVHKTKNDSDGKPSILQNRMSSVVTMGGMFGSYRYSYVNPVNPDSTVSWSGSGGGMNEYARIDLKYVEMYFDMAAFIADVDDTLTGFSSNWGVGFFAKYPFVFNAVPVKVTPLLGYGWIIFDAMDNNDVGSGGFMFGGRIDVGISKTAYLRSEYLYDMGAGKKYKGSNGMSLKAGGGFDVVGKIGFWRTELMYNLLSAYSSEYKHELGGQRQYEQRVDGKNAIHYVDIRTGIGRYIIGKASKKSR